jgi:hypothetical protein
VGYTQSTADETELSIGAVEVALREAEGEVGPRI